MKYQIMIEMRFLLLARRKVTASELAARFSISQRSVYRYARDFFEAYCAPVGSTSSPDFSFLTQDHSAVLQQPAVN